MTRNFIKGALPSVSDMGNEYMGSVYGTAALGFIASFYTAEALDSLRERCPELIVGRVRGLMRAIEGGGGKMGDLAMMRVNINCQMMNREDKYWVADFGNAAYERVLPSLTKLQNVTANALGRCKRVNDINAFARLIVAQSFACEAAEYVERRAHMLSGYSATSSDRRRYSVPFMLNTMSARPLCFHLTKLCEEIVRPRIDDGTDLLHDPQIVLGCKSVLNITGSIDTWTYARNKADELNHRSRNEA